MCWHTMILSCRINMSDKRDITLVEQYLISLLTKTVHCNHAVWQETRYQTMDLPIRMDKGAWGCSKLIGNCHWLAFLNCVVCQHEMSWRLGIMWDMLLHNACIRRLNLPPCNLGYLFSFFFFLFLLSFFFFN